MSSQMDFAERLGRIEKGDRRIISRADMADPNAVNSAAKKKRVELLDIGGRKPYWRYVFLKTVLITVLMLFSFRAVAHVQGVDMGERRDQLAAGDSNEKLAAAIIGFSMLPDPLYIEKLN
jgi:hypothetical protein